MTATVESVTIESAEAFAAESAIAEVRGIAVASVTPRCVETSHQPEGRNQKRAKDNQFYFSLPDAAAGGENDERSGGPAFAGGLATAAPAFRTLAGVLLEPDY